MTVPTNFIVFHNFLHTKYNIKWFIIYDNILWLFHFFIRRIFSDALETRKVLARRDDNVASRERKNIPGDYFMEIERFGGSHDVIKKRMCNTKNINLCWKHNGIWWICVGADFQLPQKHLATEYFTNLLLLSN